VLNAAGETPAGGAKFTIIDPVLYIRRLVPNSSLLDASNTMLLSNHAMHWPVKRERITMINVASGAQQATNRILLHRIPQSLIIAFQESTRLVGAFNKEQAVFKPHDLSKIEVRADGIEKVLTYEMNTGEKQGMLQPYRELKKLCTNDVGSFGISFEDFATKYSFFPFSLLDDSKTGIELSRKGDITCTVTFRTAPTEAISMLVLSYSDALISIDKEGKITTIGETL
jgi:hypothetical protein